MNSKYDSLKLKSRENENSFEKSLHELREEAKQIEAHENEIVPKLQRKISELETMLEAAEEDAEAQKKLAADLGMSLLFCYSPSCFLAVIFDQLTLMKNNKVLKIYIT